MENAFGTRGVLLSPAQSRRGDDDREPQPSGEPVSLRDVLNPQELAELKAGVVAAQAKKVSPGEVAAMPVEETVN
jgi:hypothetical protein